MASSSGAESPLPPSDFAIGTVHRMRHLHESKHFRTDWTKGELKSSILPISSMTRTPPPSSLPFSIAGRARRSKSDTFTLYWPTLDGINFAIFKLFIVGEMLCSSLPRSPSRTAPVGPSLSLYPSQDSPTAAKSHDIKANATAALPHLTGKQHTYSMKLLNKHAVAPLRCRIPPPGRRYLGDFGKLSLPAWSCLHRAGLSGRRGGRVSWPWLTPEQQSD